MNAPRCSPGESADTLPQDPAREGDSGIRSEFCWLLAACLGLGALVLVFGAFDVSTSPDSARLRLPLIIAAAAAFGFMIIAMAVAARIDRGGKPRRKSIRRHPPDRP